MTTTTDGNFNISPYYDDFDASKNFMQILFQPGRAVQARELSQIQSLVLDQVGDMAKHLFTDGTPVINGKITLNKNQRWILVTTGSIDAAFKNQIIIGQTSGARAIVEYLHSEYTTNPYLYIKEISGTFYEGEVIETSGYATPELQATIQGTAGTTSVYEGDYGGVATFAHNDDGIYYVNGTFIPVSSQTIMVDKSDITASNKIGFTVVKEIVTSADDTSLLDPAHGFPNFNAPGGDRYRITLLLNTRTDHDANYASNDYVDLMTLVEGEIAGSVDRTYNAVLEETLARRTSDESGDYTTKPFPMTLVLNEPGETVDANKFVVKLDPGKAYVAGYEVESIGPSYVSTNRAREFERKNNGALLFSIGPYVEMLQDLDPNNSQPTYNDKWGFDITKQEMVEFMDTVDGTGNVLFETRARYVDGNKLYLCSTCDDFSLIRSAKSLRSKSYPTYRIANLTLSGDGGTAELKGVERKQNASLLSLLERNIKSVVNNETHYTTQKVYANVNVAGNIATFTTGSSNITVNSIVQVVSDQNSYVINPSEYASGITGIGTDAVSIQFNSLTGSVTVIAEVNIAQGTYITKTMVKTTETGVASSGEVVTLANTDIYDIVSITGSNSGDVTSSFRLFNGQRDHIYDYGTLTWSSSTPFDNAETFTVEYRYFSHGNTGEYFSIDSYLSSYNNTVTGFTDLPLPYENENLRYINESGTVTYYLRDTLDFRANRTTIDASGKMVPMTDTIVYADYDYYMPRIDKVVLNSEGVFSVVNGVSDMDPIEPNTPEDSILLYKLFVPAYTFSTGQIGTEAIDNKRYTMRDIGKLEQRLDREEYYTSLSLLEQAALDMDIVDENGLDRYKAGILVDNFTGHGVGDIEHEEYNIAVDPTTGTLRMPFTQAMIDMEKAPTVDVGSDADNNIKWGENTVTLNYTEDNYIDQPLASQTMNVNPYNVFAWSGEMALTPDTDNWVDTSTNPDVNINFDGNNDGWFTDSAWSTQWNSWQTNITGVNVNMGRSTRTETVDIDWRTRRRDTITTTNTSLTTSSQENRTGIRTRVIPNTVTRDFGDRVVDVSVVPFIRARNITYTATGMKPNTNLHATFDGEVVDSACTNLTSNTNGSCTGTFSLPASTYRTGERIFRLADSLTAPTTSAETNYTASGLLQTRERTIASVTSFRTEVQTLQETRSGGTTNLGIIGGTNTTRTTGRPFRWRDPLAQSFLVTNMNGGMFITSVEIYFKTKDENIPCLVEIREMVNGYPGQVILPYASKTLNPSSINVTGNEDSPINTTKFEFTDPVFLQNNTEYCFAIISDSNEYEVYTAKIGDPELLESGLGGVRINKQPYNGVMFKSQNGSTWTADQNMDIAFKINRAKYNIASSGEINMYNEDWADTAGDGSDHRKVTTIMPTIEHMSLAGSDVTWEINFKNGTNEIGKSWMKFENYTNVEFENEVILDGSPDVNDPTQVHIRGAINSSKDNVSPIINHSRIGVVGVTNTGQPVSKCNIAGSRQNDIGTQVECVAAGGSWTDDSSNFLIQGNYVTRTVELENPAENINVWVTADKPQGTEVNVYYTTGGTIKRYVELEDGIATHTDGYTLVHIDDFERQYVHFYTSDNIVYTTPDAGAEYSGVSCYGTRAYANRDRDHGETNERRLYLINIDNVSNIQYGGWMSSEDLRDSTDWVIGTSGGVYAVGDIVKHTSGNFYKALVANQDIEPTVTAYWRDTWEKVILNKIQSSQSGSTTAKDPALISENKINWLPMGAVETSSFKQAQQAASTSSDEVVSTGFVEYEYSTMDKIEDPFTIFAIKVELKAKNPAKIASIRNFRAVAAI